MKETKIYKLIRAFFIILSIIAFVFVLLYKWIEHQILNISIKSLDSPLNTDKIRED